MKAKGWEIIENGGFVIKSQREQEPTIIARQSLTLSKWAIVLATLAILASIAIALWQASLMK